MQLYFSTDKALLKRVLLSATEEVTVLKSFDSSKMSLVQCFENSLLLLHCHGFRKNTQPALNNLRSGCASSLFVLLVRGKR